MSLSNQTLFEMINAGGGTTQAWSWAGLVLGYGTVWVIAALFAVLWHKGTAARRRDLAVLGMAALAALVASELFGLLWPQPRPLALHMGVQLSPFPLSGAGMPSDETSMLLAMGTAAFMTRELAILGFPLLTLALLAGWSLVYTGEHFPYDVAASIPVGTACAALARLAMTNMPPPLRRRLHLGDEA